MLQNKKKLIYTRTYEPEYLTKCNRNYYFANWDYYKVIQTYNIGRYKEINMIIFLVATKDERVHAQIRILPMADSRVPWTIAFANFIATISLPYVTY